jgi:hypothetical protein
VGSPPASPHLEEELDAHEEEPHPHDDDHDDHDEEQARPTTHTATRHAQRHDTHSDTHSDTNGGDGVDQTESLLHRAVNFVWEAETDYHSSAAKKKQKKQKKKSVTIREDPFGPGGWAEGRAGGKSVSEAAILDMKVTARGNNISGGFAQVRVLSCVVSCFNGTQTCVCGAV